MRVVPPALEETVSNDIRGARHEFEEWKSFDALELFGNVHSGFESSRCSQKFTKYSTQVRKPGLTVVSFPRSRRMGKDSSERTLRLGVRDEVVGVPDIVQWR